MRKGGVSKMSALIEASQLVKSLAAPPMIGDTVKRQIARAARRIPFWPTSRVKAVWYRDERYRISADDLAQLRVLADKQKRNEAHDELQQLRARVARLEESLRMADPDFHRNTLDALRRLAGDHDSAVD